MEQHQGRKSPWDGEEAQSALSSMPPYRDVKEGYMANVWGRTESELQKPDWQTRLAKVWRLLRFHNSNVKAEVRSLIQEKNLV